MCIYTTFTWLKKYMLSFKCIINLYVTGKCKWFTLTHHLHIVVYMVIYTYLHNNGKNNLNLYINHLPI